MSRTLPIEPLGGLVPFRDSIWAAAQAAWNSGESPWNSGVSLREDAPVPAKLLPRAEDVPVPAQLLPRSEETPDPADALLREADHIEVAIRVLMGRDDNEKARIFLIEAERRRAMARRIVRCVDGR